MSQPAPHTPQTPSQETLYTGLPGRSIDFAPGEWYNRAGVVAFSYDIAIKYR